MALDGDSQLVYQPVTVVFRTVHWDKAGETSELHVVEAEVADATGDGSALLVTLGGIPIHVPVAKLFPFSPAGTTAEVPGYFSAHELIRNFHPEVGSPRIIERWLDQQEADELLKKLLPR